MTQTYAIGDVHGCLAKLQNLVEQCERYARAGRSRFIFLGDYIDRGPDSRGVIDFLINFQSRSSDEIICLTGNHEDMLLTAVNDPHWNNCWLQNGGAQTLNSFRASNATDLPGKYLSWLRSLPKFFDDGQRFFVHAGIHPDRALDHQDGHDLINMRKPFLSSEKDFGRLVVHGHTPTSTRLPDIRPNRLNIDTGAVFGGPLTAAVFGDDAVSARRFLTSR